MNDKKSYYHNEIEFMRIDDVQLKNKIEKIFLQNRISYYIRWEKPAFWKKILGKNEENRCKICINGWDKEKALELTAKLDTAIVGRGEILLKRTESSLPDIYIHKND